MLAPVRVVPSDLAHYSGRITPAVMVQVRHENSDVREQERYRKSDLRHFCRSQDVQGWLLEEAGAGGLMRGGTASFAAISCSVVFKTSQVSF